MAKILRYCTFLIVLLPFYTSAQKILQIETRGSMKVTRFYIGDVISFQIKSLKGVWIKDIIRDIDIENDLLVLDQRDVSPSNIITMRDPPKNTFLNNTLPDMFTYGSYTLLPASLGAIVIDGNEQAALNALYIFAGGQLVGRGLRGFKKRKTKLGKRHRLRLLDLSL